MDKTSSIRQEAVDTAVVQDAVPPRAAIVAANPTFGYVVEYVTSAVLMVRREPTAEASFAAIRDRRRFGIAIAAMIKMIATTINSSINENPFSCFRIGPVLPFSSDFRLEVSWTAPQPVLNSRNLD